jgi:hypothetical protein
VSVASSELAAPEPPAPVLSPNSRLAFPQLSIVREDDEFLVGDPRSGTFIAIPEVGVVALRVLEDGRTVAEAAEAAASSIPAARAAWERR